MFGNSWHIGRIFGIPLRVHISWFLVFALVAWQGRSYFPYVLPQFPSWEYWTMGIVAALLLFASVLLHGGRVLRAALWAWSKNFHKATRQAARAGQGFAVLLMLVGAWDLVAGLAIGGVWFLLIGAFLYTAAHNTHRQVAFQESLMGLRVGDVMTPEVVVLEAGTPLDEAVDNYFLRFLDLRQR